MLETQNPAPPGYWPHTQRQEKPQSEVSLFPNIDKCCAQRRLDLQGVEMKIPKPNYQTKFILSWHTKHPLAIGTPATNSLQFSPSSFLGSCTYLASVVITRLSHRYSWSTGGRWYSSSRRYKLWLPACFKFYMIVTQFKVPLLILQATPLLYRAGFDCKLSDSHVPGKNMNLGRKSRKAMTKVFSGAGTQVHSNRHTAATALPAQTEITSPLGNSYPEPKGALGTFSIHQQPPPNIICCP